MSASWPTTVNCMRKSFGRFLLDWARSGDRELAVAVWPPLRVFAATCCRASLFLFRLRLSFFAQPVELFLLLRHWSSNRLTSRASSSETRRIASVVGQGPLIILLQYSNFRQLRWPLFPFAVIIHLGLMQKPAERGPNDLRSEHCIERAHARWCFRDGTFQWIAVPGPDIVPPPSSAQNIGTRPRNQPR